MKLDHALLGLYIFVLGMVCIYGLHRYHLVYLYYKHRRNRPKITSRFAELPRVTVQLPMYNELYVARRVIESACQIEYPRDRLQIQVLDDSTDETTEIARETVERMRALGHDIELIHRDNRHGFKAGALAEATTSSTGEFISIFDADFIPPADIFQETIHHFVDPGVGMVQIRWEHLNREHSLLTRAQAVLLDGHFVMEHGARNRSGRFISFNGTAGIWRRRCIEDAGGWQHDTLTEDLDLSYRAQLRGWRFLFVPDISSPAELPPDMGAFKAQQRRWAKGGAQTCRKLLGQVLRAPLPLKVKLEAFFHLTSCTVYFYMVILTLLLFPVLWLRVGKVEAYAGGNFLVDISLFIVASCSASTFYVASQRELFRTWAESLKYLPFLMSLGVGISLSNAYAAFQGFMGQQSEFVRTPKFGVASAAEKNWRSRAAYRPVRKRNWQPLLELVMGAYMVVCLVLSVEEGWITIGLPFMCLFAVGYFYVGITSLLDRPIRALLPGTEIEDEAAAAAELMPAVTPLAARAPDRESEPRTLSKSS